CLLRRDRGLRRPLAGAPAPVSLLGVRLLSRISATMIPSRAADDENRPRLSPPVDVGLVRKSPSVAPSGRVRMKAAQNRMLFEATRSRQSTATTTRAPAKTSAPRR